MKTTCLIIDDEKLARELVKELLQGYEQVDIIGECENGAEAVKVINQNKPDILFLDVQMPGMTGFDVLDEIDYEPHLIFTTSHDKYAIQAFERNAVDYLLKPIDEQRFQQAMDRALRRQAVAGSKIEDLLFSMRAERTAQTFDSHLFVQKSEKLFNLPVEDIQHLEASGDYTIITTKTDQFVSSSGIGKLEEILNPDDFIRVHRSTIVNVTFLKEIERHFNGGMIVKMTNGKSFPVSRTYAKLIRRRMV
jgi:two-component system LytT family response regulator